MKGLFILVLISFSFKAIGQDEKLLYATKYEKYRKMKNTGTVMLAAGAIMAVVGIAKMSSATYTQSYGVYTSTDPQATAGALLFLGGAGLLGGGIPLTIIGSKKARKYQQKLDEVSFNLNVIPQRQQYGLTLRYTFGGKHKSSLRNL